jgi:Cu+-exporting ATPase
VGDIVTVKPREKIPVHGVITAGYSSVDEQLPTGESIPVEKTVGSKLLAAQSTKLGS